MTSAKAQGLFVGLELGTHEARGVVFDAGSAEIVAQECEPYRPGADRRRTRERNPDVWVDAAAELSRRLTVTLGRHASHIRAVSVSGHEGTLVLLDQNGRVTRPALLATDDVATGVAMALSERLGRHVAPGSPVANLAWLHASEELERVTTVLSAPAFLNFCLTGAACAEASEWSTSGWFDATTKTLDRSILTVFEGQLREWLPPLVQASDIIGTITPQASERFRLPEGALVGAGGGNVAMTAIGAGVHRAHAAVLILEATAVIAAHTSPMAAGGARVRDSVGELLAIDTVAWPAALLDRVADLADLKRSALLSLIPRTRGASRLQLDGDQGAYVLTGVESETFTSGQLAGAIVDHLIARLAGCQSLERRAELRVAGHYARYDAIVDRIAGVVSCPIAVVATDEGGALGAALQAEWTARVHGGRRGPPLSLAPRRTTVADRAPG